MTCKQTLRIPRGEVEQNAERRQHRRHDLEPQRVLVERWDGPRRNGLSFGHLVNLSAGGARIQTKDGHVKPDQQIRLRIQLPAYAGISPFVDTSGDSLRPKSEWVGWLAVTRVQPMRGGEYEVAGRLMDMEEIDRGMLGLYLSTQPLAA